MPSQPDKSPKITRRQQGGVTKITVEDHSLPLVRFTVASPHGVLLDAPGKQGAASLAWELCTRGTEAHDRESFNRALERLGSQLEFFCGYEMAGLQAYALRRNAPATFALFTEALTRPAFRADELEALSAEQEERLTAERDEDDVLASVFFRRAVYRDHPLQHWSRGYLETVPRIVEADVHEVWRRSVHAHGLVLGASGDVTPDELDAWAADLIAALPANSEGPSLLIPEPTPVQGLHITLVDKPDRHQGQLRVGRLGLPGQHPDLPALYLATVAFGGTFTSPLTHEVRDKRGWSYVAAAEMPRRRRYAPPWSMVAVPNVKDTVDCLALQVELYQGFATGGIDRPTLDFARDYLLNRYPFEVATANDLLMPAIQLELAGSSIEDVFAFPRIIEGLDVGQVPEVVRRHMSPNDLCVVIVATAHDVEADLRHRFPGAKVSVVSWKDALARP